MVIESGPKKNEKPGLLGLGFKRGDSIPWLEEAGIGSRVDKEGRVEWQVLDPEVVAIINSYDREAYQHRKNQDLVMALSQARRRFAMALNGSPVSQFVSRWFGEPMPVPWSQGDQTPLWEVAPNPIQKIVFENAAEKSALQYLHPQLHKNS